MSKFQRLVKSAAEKLRKSQAEMNQLAEAAPQPARAPEAPAAPTLEERLARVAKNTLGDVPAGFKMYHGSPHEFEKFDFINNLKKGEGALAFGPGGYLTGHEPLAREYATTLASRVKPTGPKPPFSQPMPAAFNTGDKAADKAKIEQANRAIRLFKRLERAAPMPSLSEAMARSPEDTLEALRAGNVGMLYRGGWRADVPRTFIAPSRRPGGRPSDIDKLVASRVTPHDVESYADLMQLVFGNQWRRDDLHFVMQAGDQQRAADDIQKFGREMRQALASREKTNSHLSNPKLRPRLEVKKLPAVPVLPDEDWSSKMTGIVERQGRPFWVPTSVPAKYGWTTVLDQYGDDLHALNKFIDMNPQQRRALPKPLKINTRPGQKSDLRTYENWAVKSTGNSDFDAYMKWVDAKRSYKNAPHTGPRHLYEIDSPFAPADMLPYDYPLEHASPRVLGALAQLLESPRGSKLLGQDPLNLDDPALWQSLSGRSFMRSLESLEPQEAAKMMKEAGIPGLYYLRGGRRAGAGDTPRGFDPNDYNFVIFDDEKLPIPKRTKFADGGAVVKS